MDDFNTCIIILFTVKKMGLKRMTHVWIYVDQTKLTFVCFGDNS